MIFQGHNMMGQYTSSRTLACIKFQGHNGDGTEHKFKDIWICNKEDTTVTGLIHKSRTGTCLNQQFILQCPCYTMLHTSTAREAGIASPHRLQRRHQQATTSCSPQQPQKLRLLLPPDQRRRHQQAFPEDYMQYSSRVTNRVPDETHCPNHLEVRPNEGETYADMNTQSHEHFIWTLS